MKKYFAAAIALTLLGGCGLSDTDKADAPSSDDKVIHIGSFVPQTGPVPSYKLIAEGSKTYFDQINDAGGINGYTFKFDQVDDGYDPARSLAATKRLVQDDVFALVAPIGTPTNSAVKPYAIQQKLPVIGPVSGDPEIKTLPNYFSLLPNYHDEAALVTNYVAGTMKKTKVAVLYENDDLGKPALAGAKEALKALNLQPVAEVAFNVADTDLTAQVTKAKQAGAEATILWGSNTNLATALTAGQKTGFTTQWIAPFYAADPNTYTLTGNLLDGTVFGSWLLPSSADQVANYRTAMEKAGHKNDVGVFSLNGWTNAALFGEAVKTATTGGAKLTKDSLLNALATGFNARAVGGAPQVTFDAANHNGTRSLSIIQAGGGTFKAITEPIPFGRA
jgi:branched-chain amino acid transport system substrate-binding protein